MVQDGESPYEGTEAGGEQAVDVEHVLHQHALQHLQVGSVHHLLNMLSPVTWLKIARLAAHFVLLIAFWSFSTLTL